MSDTRRTKKLDIPTEAGFANQAHLTNAFGKRFGAMPARPRLRRPPVAPARSPKKFATERPSRYCL
jgi:hypothetical protein